MEREMEGEMEGGRERNKVGGGSSLIRALFPL
jgi:hypothetical protein